MKIVLLFALATCSIAAKLPGAEHLVRVLEDIRDGPIGAIYNNVLELDNGVSFRESGSEGSAGQSNAEGSYSFVAPDGTSILVTYVANELGFQPQSDALPVDHPLPPHAVEQLRIAEEQRAQGIVFDERGFQV